ncbi:MAG: FKBP-type peptidyl-prolyl cis-trans isomerase [Cytophagales bacterium]
MLKLTKFAISALAAVVLLSSCGKEPNYKKSDNGLEYYFYEDKEGETAKVGDFLTVNFIYKTDKDSILRNTWKDGNPLQVIVQSPTFKGGLEEGLQMLSEGDSVAFKMSADSLFKKTFMAPRPDFIDSASKITFIMKVIKVQNKEVFEKEQAIKMEERKKQMEEQMANQRGIDDKLIQDYLAANKLKAQKTESGVYYIITKAGKGKTPPAGSMVQVNYVGKLLSGQEFDSSVGKGPLEFTVGVRQVIPGWDEGISLLNEGSKATIIIPSPLGYGPMAAGDKIPANSVLLFDVELVKIMVK